MMAVRAAFIIFAIVVANINYGAAAMTKTETDSRASPVMADFVSMKEHSDGESDGDRLGLHEGLVDGLKLGLHDGLHDIPLPSADVLKWLEMEIGVMITFNMATFMPTCAGNGLCATVGGCKGWLPPRDTFNPVGLDTDQWAQSMVEYGAKYGVLVIQHCGGFSMFQTNEETLKATGFNYTYSVDFTQWGDGKRDIMAEFVASCKKFGLRPAVYYSLNHNYYLNVGSGKVLPGPLLPGQVNVTQALYEKIALAQYTQLLTNYGEQAEVWFDGGMSVIPGFADLVLEKQPHAVYLNGVAPPSTKGGRTNNVRWVGTESGTPAHPVWSTTGKYGEAGAGAPFPQGAVFDPAEVDTTLYSIDHWFWSNLTQFKIRSLEELQNIYHASVGNNGHLLMNLTPNSTGLVPDAHAARYKAAGAWAARCYGASNVVANASSRNGAASLTLGPFDRAVDRVAIQEDLAQGERVLAFALADGQGNAVGGGTAVGYKRIAMLARTLAKGERLTLTVTKALLPPMIKAFAAFAPCS